MNLSEIYQNQVKKNQITNLSVGSNMPVIENRDPTINKLENKLKETFQKILPQTQEPQETPSLNVRPISFEDAIRELATKNK
jgi:hypothetical protein